LADSDPTATLDPLDEAETWDKYAQLGLDWDLGTWGNIRADTAYRDRINDSRFPDPLFPFATKNHTDTWSFTPRYTWEGQILGFSNNVIAGVDLYKSDQDLDSFSGFFSPVASLSGVSEIERDTVGYYFNDEISILQNLFVTAGIRRERVEYDFQQVDLSGAFAPLDDRVSDWETGYVGGIVYQYDGRSSVFGRANRSFRFPLTDELVIFDFPNSRIRVNPDIRPQTGRHYEVGIRHFFTPEIRANVTLFRAEIDDEIFFNPATFTNENYPETLHQGVELGAEARLWDRLAVFGNYTYEKAEFKKGPFDGNDIPAVPRHKGNVGVRIYDVVPGLVVSALYNYVGFSYIISDQANQFDRLDNYYTVDLRLTYDWRRMTAFVGVNNLTDEEYSTYGVVGGGGTTPFFYPAPDRNWVAGVEFRY
jgi:iron complex outermembrane receptor protein